MVQQQQLIFPHGRHCSIILSCAVSAPPSSGCAPVLEFLGPPAASAAMAILLVGGCAAAAAERPTCWLRMGRGGPPCDDPIFGKDGGLALLLPDLVCIEEARREGIVERGLHGCSLQGYCLTDGERTVTLHGRSWFNHERPI